MADICSMTGFASWHGPLRQGGKLAIDLKAVNSRYLEIFVRLPDALRHLEARLRQRLQERLTRGKIELSISLELSAAAGPCLNHERLGPLLEELRALQVRLPGSHLELASLLQLPGVLSSGPELPEDLDELLLGRLGDCLEQLLHHRLQEGRQLREAICTRLDAVSGLLDGVEGQLSTLVERERGRLQEKLAGLQLNLDPARLEQEIVLAAQKSDIAEEYDRLRAHVRATRTILEQGGSCGKKLDFIMQEFNREANTMAAKSSTLDLTQTAVELKVLIEQMREQVQNLD